MYERFTERARKAMALANQEALRLRHEYIGTEHILLGLVKEGTGVGAGVLKFLGVDLAAVREAAEKLVKPGPDKVAPGKLPHTPLAKKVIEYAIEESRGLNHNYVGTEHLLLGLGRQQEGVAAQVFTNLGLGLDRLRDEVRNLLRAATDKGARPAAAAEGPSPSPAVPPSPPEAPSALRQFLLTPAMGKRLIGKGLLQHGAIQAVLRKGTLAIVAGTTNGYVAEEILRATAQDKEFSRAGFRRGMVVPPSLDVASIKSPTAGDVILTDGIWQKGKEIFDVVDEMKAGDVILKGANALDVRRGRAAVYVGHPMGGTVGASIPAVIGRRTLMIVPVGLEKRVADDVQDLADMLNSPHAEGPRMMVLPGQVFTELDAIRLLTGASATLVAGGGVHGAEGAVWIAVRGLPAQVQAAEALVKSLAAEPPCQA